MKRPHIIFLLLVLISCSNGNQTIENEVIEKLEINESTTTTISTTTSTIPKYGDTIEEYLVIHLTLLQSKLFIVLGRGHK